MVTLALAGDSAGTARYAAKSDDLGNFEIRNVSPGSYIASAETVVVVARSTPLMSSRLFLMMMSIAR